MLQSRSKAPPGRRYGASGKTVSPPARNPARTAVRVDAGPAHERGPDGGFPGAPRAANQSDARRGSLAVRSRLQESVPRMTENPREDSACRRVFGVRRSIARRARGRGWRIPGLTTMEGRADNFSLDINSVTAA